MDEPIPVPEHTEIVISDVGQQLEVEHHKFLGSLHFHEILKYWFRAVLEMFYWFKKWGLGN
jgi:hypothetical protein